MSGIPLSPDRKFVSPTREYGVCWGEQTAVLHAPSSLTSKPSKVRTSYNEYIPEKRARMGRYGAKNCLSKVTKHFPLLSDGKLTCSLRWSGYD